MKVSFSREYVNENSMLGLLNLHFVGLMVRPDSLSLRSVWLSEASCLFWFLPLRHDVVTNIFALEISAAELIPKLIQSHVCGECSDVSVLPMKLQLVVSRF